MDRTDIGLPPFDESELQPMPTMSDDASSSDEDEARGPLHGYVQIHDEHDHDAVEPEELGEGLDDAVVRAVERSEAPASSDAREQAMFAKFLPRAAVPSATTPEQPAVRAAAAVLSSGDAPAGEDFEVDHVRAAVVFSLPALAPLTLPHVFRTGAC